MIRTTGFKRAFLMPTNRRPRHFSESPGRRIGDHSQGFFAFHDVPFFITSLFFASGHGALQYQKQHYPSGITRNPSTNTFKRLFLLPWKNK